MGICVTASQEKGLNEDKNKAGSKNSPYFYAVLLDDSFKWRTRRSSIGPIYSYYKTREPSSSWK